jgi:hypothetical protein
MADLAKEPVVEEHRLLVIFEDSDRDRPVDLSNTGVVSHEDTSFACPSRMNVQYAETLEKRDQQRQKIIQAKIDDLEQNIQWPKKRAPSEDVTRSCERLHSDHKRIHDRRAKNAKEASEKEQKALTTAYNNSSLKFSEVGTARFDMIEKQFWRQKAAHEAERKKNEDEEFKKLQEKAVHANVRPAKGNEATERLYEDGLAFLVRKEDAVLKEQERQQEETCMYEPAPGTVNVDDLVQKLLNDGKEEQERKEKKRKEALDKIKSEACQGVTAPSAERQTDALRHAHALSATWKRHERFRMLLQARYQEAEDELIKHQSVGHEAPPDWKTGGLEAMVNRLYPHNDVRHPVDNSWDADKEGKSTKQAGWSDPPSRQQKDAASKDARTNPDAFEGGSVAVTLDDPRLMGALIDEGVAQSLPRPAKGQKAAQSKAKAKASPTQVALATQSSTPVSTHASSTHGSPKQKQKAPEIDTWNDWSLGHSKSGGGDTSPRSPVLSPRLQENFEWDYFGGDTKAKEKHTSSRSHEALDDEEAQAAATKIQAMYRGKKARQDLDKEHAKHSKQANKVIVGPKKEEANKPPIVPRLSLPRAEGEKVKKGAKAKAGKTAGTFF